jgi:EAL domain-containing protein (putative c-di-GMP-specific phosphodiesterase class I)/GGDEF domain-containing protein
MSLIKQLWLTIVGVLLLAFVGSLFIGVTTSRHYIEQEVRIKNADNANALALSMSQVDKDPVALDLLLAAQFDTGHYRRIELHDAAGELLNRRVASDPIGDVPGWFVDLVRFEVPPGRAVVQDGWRQFGTLKLESQHRYAYHALWRSSLGLVGWLALGGAISLLLASWIVRTIRRPLRAVVAQAQAIGERRFTVAEAPRTLELREVVQAMNRLSGAVRQMLEQESRKLDQLHRQLQHDPLTDTLARAPFLERLEASLRSNRRSGALALVRVGQLDAVNRQLGHPETDALLVELAGRLDRLTQRRGEGVVGRLNGSDFALLIPHAHDLEALGAELKESLETLGDHPALPRSLPLSLPSALTEYAQEASRSALLARLDAALASAESRGSLGQVIIEPPAQDLLYSRHDDWHRALREALAHGVRLAHYPVLDARGELLHHEVPSRLRLKGEWRPAALFLPWVSRLKLASQLDLAAVSAALDDTTASGSPVGINLSSQSLNDAGFVTELVSRVRTRADVAPRLWFELPESAPRHAPDAYRRLCQALQPLGCHLGLEHVGPRFGQIPGLQDLGLSYLKIDAALIKGIETQPEHQSLLSGMTSLAHSLGIQVIAEGVESEQAASVLFTLGMDGVTGPAIRQASGADPGAVC